MLPSPKEEFQQRVINFLYWSQAEEGFDYIRGLTQLEHHIKVAKSKLTIQHVFDTEETDDEEL